MTDQTPQVLTIKGRDLYHRGVKSPLGILYPCELAPKEPLDNWGLSAEWERRTGKLTHCIYCGAVLVPPEEKE